MQELRTDGLAEVALRVNAFMVELKAARAAPGPERVQGLFDACNAIFSLAGTFSLTFLSRTSRATCALLEGLREAGLWNEGAILVHSEAMRASMTAMLEPKEQEELLLGLEKVAAKALRRAPAPNP